MNNEILIDGVNVAECEQFKDLKCRQRTCGSYFVMCEGQSCQFKQLKRLEAENKQLNELFEEEGKIIQCKTGTIFTLVEQNKVLRKENKQLKQENQAYRRSIKDTNIVAIVEENERLKKEYNELYDKYEQLQSLYQDEHCDNLKYKKALEDISEIAYTTDFDIVDIQAIVDEVLDEE